MRRLRAVIGWIALAIGVVALLAVGFLYVDARRRQTAQPQYVALGSSMAAGIGLGDRIDGSPVVCQRTAGSYPAQLARMRNLSLADVSCSGATTAHVLRGGQVFIGPQIDALSPETRLVTLTIGGNDINYVGDLTFMAGTRESSLMGWAIRRLWSGPSAQRDYAKLKRDVSATLAEIRRRSPRARTIVVGYPQILPDAGDGCPTLGLTAREIAVMRDVGNRLTHVTQRAAAEAKVDFIEMQRLGASHHACASTPWVNGWHDARGTPFHLTLAGATATAQAISRKLETETQP